MPKPKSKQQIAKRLQTERRRLEQNLALLSPEDMVQPGAVGPWSVKDVLAHLADWEARMLGWVAATQRGEDVKTPDPDYTWRQIDSLNQRIYAAHRDQSLDEVLADFRSTHARFMTMVNAMPEEDMLADGRYPFMGDNAIYTWFSGYAAHDLWGKTQIRKWMKAQGRLGKSAIQQP
jgi:hypothetical protein